MSQAIADDTKIQQTYERFEKRIKEIATLGSIGGLLSWDQETYMPKKGNAFRAEQMALLSGLRHEKFTTSALGEELSALEEAADALSPEQRANVRETRRSYDKAVKLPKEFVSELSKTCSLAHDAWIKARKESDWSTFGPELRKIVALKRQQAEYIGYEGEAYNALLDNFEPGMTAKEVSEVLNGLKDTLVPLADAILAVEGPAPIAGPFPKAAQERFGKRVAAAMGFDFEAGRLDVSAHPFCSGFQPRDVRITTRYNEADLRQALFGVVHEAGHGLYEQGLLAEAFGTPMGSACSTGLHESQSRMWENVIARSRPFWEHFFPILQEEMGAPLANVTLDHFHKWVNEVERSLIRVEADEVTYNLHILMRFEIERALFAGDLGVDDLPGIWNEKMRTYLGLTPPDDAQGVLQDIHWSFGGFGYFPTYSLGNLYASQIFDVAQGDLPTLWDDVSRGELTGLKGWLNTNVHERGCLYKPGRLVEEISGKPLSADAFNTYMKQKFTAIYGL
ncbi:MAG: carboxypeptidase M32 [Planctomycetota bacterium]|jgi:carboxypeptidase Taq